MIVKGGGLSYYIDTDHPSIKSLLPSEWADQSNPVLCIWHVSISAMGTINCSALSQNIGHVALRVNAVHNKSNSYSPSACSYVEFYFLMNILMSFSQLFAPN